MSDYIIETKNLTKQYGAQKSAADLNIHAVFAGYETTSGHCPCSYARSGTSDFV